MFAPQSHKGIILVADDHDQQIFTNPRCPAGIALGSETRDHLGV